MTDKKQNDRAEKKAAAISEFLVLAQRAEIAEIERDAARRELACERAAKKLAVERAEKAEAKRDEARALLREARRHIYHLTDPEIDTSGFLARIDAVIGPPPPETQVDLDTIFKGDRS